MAPVVLITGTSTGVGAACVTRLAAGGWTVLAGVRRVVDGEALVARVEGDVRPLLMDVTDEVAIERAEEGTVAAVVRAYAWAGAGWPLPRLQPKEQPALHSEPFAEPTCLPASMRALGLADIGSRSRTVTRQAEGRIRYSCEVSVRQSELVKRGVMNSHGSQIEGWRPNASSMSRRNCRTLRRRRGGADADGDGDGESVGEFVPGWAVVIVIIPVGTHQYST
jgi:hypothetical protein